MRTPDGRVWTCAQYGYAFFLRYLEVFDHVEVVSRVCDVPVVPSHWQRVDGSGVSLIPVPYYIGPWQYLRRRPRIMRVFLAAAKTAEAVIFRGGSSFSDGLTRAWRTRPRPFGVEVVGDPWEVFSPGAFTHPLRPFFRLWFYRQQARLCLKASAVAYVTKHTLQRRYPARAGALSASYSDVELDNDAFVSSPRASSLDGTPITLLTVATLAQLYKGQDTLISAMARCARQGLDLHLVLVGDGHYRSRLENQAADLGLGERIRFLGELPSGAAVRAELDRADLFVLPSRTEGLPRALVEAMARGLPCVGSTAGGIPELLEPCDLVRPNDVQALAEKVREVVTQPHRRAEMALRNLQRARQYHETLLRKTREDFYRYVKDRTAYARPLRP